MRTACTSWCPARRAWATAWSAPAPASSCRPGRPYAYTAGPEGIQILEFRGVGSFDMKITEGADRWARIVETVREQGETWREEAANV